MATLTEPKKPSDWLKAEDDKSKFASRDAITVVSGSGVLTTGMVLGKITTGTATSALKASGANTGNGTMTVDVTAPVQPGAKAGIYTVRITVATANAGTFVVEDPDGNPIGSGNVGSTFTDRIKFVMNDGSTDYVVGDGFDITVTAGSGKYKRLTVADLLGGQIAAGLLIDVSVDATSADKTAAAIVRNAEVSSNSITWPASITDSQKATATTQLAALGIIIRTGA